MLKIRGKVQYKDGTITEFEAGTVALAAYEEYALRHGYPYGNDAPNALASLVIAHFALGIEEGFEPWRKRIVHVETEFEGIPPTVPEALAG